MVCSRFFLGGHIGPPLRLALSSRVIVGADRRVCPLLFAVFLCGYLRLFNLPPQRCCSSLFIKRDSYVGGVRAWLILPLFRQRGASAAEGVRETQQWVFLLGGHIGPPLRWMV